MKVVHIVVIRDKYTLSFGCSVHLSGFEPIRLLKNLNMVVLRFFTCSLFSGWWPEAPILLFKSLRKLSGPFVLRGLSIEGETCP